MALAHRRRPGPGAGAFPWPRATDTVLPSPYHGTDFDGGGTRFGRERAGHLAASSGGGKFSHAAAAACRSSAPDASGCARMSMCPKQISASAVGAAVWRTAASLEVVCPPGPANLLKSAGLALSASRIGILLVVFQHLSESLKDQF